MSTLPKKDEAVVAEFYDKFSTKIAFKSKVDAEELRDCLHTILTAKNAEIEEARREIPTFKQFKDFLAENCVDGRKYLDGKYDRKIYKFLNPDPLPTKE